MIKVLMFKKKKNLVVEESDLLLIIHVVVASSWHFFFEYVGDFRKEKVMSEKNLLIIQFKAENAEKYATV